MKPSTSSLTMRPRAHSARHPWLPNRQRAHALRLAVGLQAHALLCWLAPLGDIAVTVRRCTASAEFCVSGLGQPRTLGVLAAKAEREVACVKHR